MVSGLITQMHVFPHVCFQLIPLTISVEKSGASVDSVDLKALSIRNSCVKLIIFKGLNEMTPEINKVHSNQLVLCVNAIIIFQSVLKLCLFFIFFFL